MHRGKRETPGEESIRTRFVGVSRPFGLAITDFEDEFLIGKAPILPRYDCRIDPRLAAINHAKIAYDHQMSFRLDKLRAAAREPF
jgi:hypothetical protein